MISYSVKNFSLSGMIDILVGPDEDFYIYLEFETDQSGVTPSLVVEEYKWPYMSNAYVPLSAETIASGFIVEDTELITNGRIKLKITKAMSENWKHRKLWLKLYISDGTDEWLAASRTLTILNRD